MTGSIGSVLGGALVVGAGLLASVAVLAGDEDTSVTIYSSAQPGAIPPELYRPLPGDSEPLASAVPGYAMVRQDRVLRIAAGRSTLKFTDVAALIDPTTVTFASLSDSSTRVLEQNFQFDLVSSRKLLLRYLDRPISVERVIGGQTLVTSGTLLSAADGLVLRAGDGTVSSLRDWSAVRFPELPGGLDTKPTLVWDITSASGGEQRTRVAYQTGGMTWWTDYNLVLSDGKDSGSGFVDLSAWVSIINQSGATYPDAKLKLIAGDVNRVQPSPPRLQAKVMNLATASAADAGFEQKTFFEFHLYTLGRRTTLPNNSTKQIELTEQAKHVPARRLLIYAGPSGAYGYGGPLTERQAGLDTSGKVDAWLEFRNDKQHGLGAPLPAGRVRVSKVDAADGSLEFIGEDRIDHTPKDESVRVRLGSAFDVVGERRQVDFVLDSKGRRMEEEVEIKLRNHKDEPVEVLVRESLYRWTNWTIVSNSQDFRKENARTIIFPVKVARDGESVVRYRARYTW